VNTKDTQERIRVEYTDQDADMTKRIDEWGDPPETGETNLWVGLIALLIIFLAGVSIGWFVHILI
jgi:hypothetical protein